MLSGTIWNIVPATELSDEDEAEFALMGQYSYVGYKRGLTADEATELAMARCKAEAAGFTVGAKVRRANGGPANMQKVEGHVTRYTYDFKEGFRGYSKDKIPTPIMVQWGEGAAAWEMQYPENELELIK